MCANSGGKLKIRLQLLSLRLQQQAHELLSLTNKTSPLISYDSQIEASSQKKLLLFNLKPEEPIQNSKVGCCSELKIINVF
jgi:hypothetical protein